MQVQGANKRHQQRDNRAAALGQKQHHQHDGHRHIQQVAAFLLQQHRANKDTDTAIAREVDHVGRAGILRRNQAFLEDQREVDRHRPDGEYRDPSHDAQQRQMSGPGMAK